MTTQAFEQPSERATVEAVMRDIFALPRKDQIRIAGDLIEYINAESTASIPRISEEVQAREETLTALGTVARHLGLTDRAPIVREFESVAAGLGLAVTKHHVIKAWGRWRFAQEALLGIGHRESPAQRELRRKTSGRKRTNEQVLAGVREWLDSGPTSILMPDYDFYVKQANDTGRTPPLVTAAAVKVGLSLSWDGVLKVASGEAFLADIHERDERNIIDRDDPLQLVTVPETALLLGVHKRVANDFVRSHDGPTVVATIGSGHVFYKHDVLAYRYGHDVPERVPGEVQCLIWDGTAIANLLGMKTSSMPSYRQGGYFDKIPPHSGQVGNRYYYLRDAVRVWAATHRRDLLEALR